MIGMCFLFVSCLSLTHDKKKTYKSYIIVEIVGKENKIVSQLFRLV